MLILIALAQPAFAGAAPLSFDCDVPSDHYSSVSEEASGTMAVSGTIEAVELRAGNNLPVAGARIASADGKTSFGLQLVAASSHAKQFDIVLNTRRGDEAKRNTLGQVGTDGPISFILSLSDTGKVSLLVGSRSFQADFTAFSSGKVAAFCSTGQFKFSNLTFAPAERSGSTSN
ncbi:hypothetical protein [Sphingomonas nostoxanthinifaciens]|uniref:hypothetical protein n=1 Tax=Sphingomonas nostoxanthinifaciens TaxID=2872652 RepID=UPI001CC1D8B6|nr:hypothetical protein [Sphingomonas nostoxanthinifaciens]UAK24423.1 hypothetical protein K8P63_19280 [Sphingomonas nostoxanthinifaciens]